MCSEITPKSAPDPDLHPDIPSDSPVYRVLARKYRPRHFDDLVGQDALVRTLRNAIESGRIAHAFMLTGIRGIGKTTTARIIAKALNYAGPDGTAAPTTRPTDDCPICNAIAEDRHPDVIEMDAASRTGVDDIREILDGVRYAPAAARYKIYIIDEVHMLSKNAFNALLKTLEEPPAHVKFIFATTEIRKVPVTVLSRCQRFDLRRIDAPTLSAYYADIARKEGVEIDPDALALIARAADGSVRDGLSMLDQAIALGGGHPVTVQQVRDMLGLSDRARVLDLLEHVLSGHIAQALDVMESLYREGADPLVLLQDLLDSVHTLTRIKAIGAASGTNSGSLSAAPERSESLAQRLSMATLGMSWQILLKGLSDVQSAPVPQSAAEMTLIRLAYTADLPDPRDMLRHMKDPTNSGTTHAEPASGSPSPRHKNSLGGSVAYAVEPAPTQSQSLPATMEEIVACLHASGEHILAGQVFQHVHPVRLSAGRLEFYQEPESPVRLAQDLGRALQKATGTRWMVSVTSDSHGAQSLAQKEKANEARRLDIAGNHPLVRKVHALFPDARILRLEE